MNEAEFEREYINGVRITGGEIDFINLCGYRHEFDTCLKTKCQVKMGGKFFVCDKKQWLKTTKGKNIEDSRAKGVG